MPVKVFFVLLLSFVVGVCAEDPQGSRAVAAGSDTGAGPFWVACPALGCSFVSESRSRLSNARRAVRGHVLRVHRADVPGGRLERLTPAQVQERLETFQRGQMNAGRRRLRGAVSGQGSRPLPSGATRARVAPLASAVGGPPFSPTGGRV